MTQSPVPADVTCLADYERHAAAILPPPIWAYLAGAGADGITQRSNREAWARLKLRGRVLRDLGGASTRLSLLGLDLAHPLIVAPTAFHRLAHPQGEAATALGAGAAEALMVVSTQTSTKIEDIAAAAHGPLWFQLYLQPRRADTERLVRRAEACGCKALVLTVDAPICGIRNDELRAGFRLPEGVEPVLLRDMVQPSHRAGPGQSPVFLGLLDHAPRWEDVLWLRSLTDLPLLLKGITDPQDALLALEHGADGIIVSNHGGRVLDTLPASAELLPEIVAAIRGRVPVLVDGGIRRGTDVLKARALGADAVLLGLPILAALAVAGAVGVVHALTLLRAELEAAMALTGAARWSEVDSNVLWARKNLF